MVDKGQYLDWIRDYVKKTGDEFIDDSHNVEVNEHGFLTWFALDEKFWGVNVYGDGKFWDAWVQAKARELGCTTICFLTRRNPKVWERRHGYRLAAYVMEKKV